jgi:hypothetical protein
VFISPRFEFTSSFSFLLVFLSIIFYWIYLPSVSHA